MTTFTKNTFVELLSKMISNVERLQNNPPKLVPMESLIADIVEDELKDCPFVELIRSEYLENRTNLIIRYTNPSENFTDKTLGLVGSHMDVVPANPDEWHVDPFKLTVDENDDDILWGRGTTDCLGHVALVTLLLKYLSTNDIKLDYTLGVVFIADEENGTNPEIGIDHLARDGHLDFLKNGPVYWLDSSDVYPTVGSGTGMSWELKVSGKKGHSGMPHNCINPLLPAFEAVKELLKVFKENFPAHENDHKYKYQVSSNMKPTQIVGTQGSINQIPEEVIIQGDVRLTPFYDWEDVRKVLKECIDNLNTSYHEIPKLHEAFNLILDDKDEEETIRFELRWFDQVYEGIACDMESIGFKLLSDATQKHMGNMDIVSCTGSLPLIADLQKLGFDMQIIGYGNGDAYHANNEYCRFSGMEKGYNILLDVIMNY